MNRTFIFSRWMSKKVLFLVLLYFMTSTAGFSQLNIGGEPKSFSESVKSDIPKAVMPRMDVTKAKEEDLTNTAKNKPWRIGLPIPVDYNLGNSGTWDELPNGDRIWRLSISSPEALSISLLYNDFYLPPGALMYLYNEQKTQVLGAFTERNNKPTRQFATALTHGDMVTIEYYEPQAVRGQGAIAISQVGHIYRGMDSQEEDNASLGNSGNCQVDVNCSEGNAWQNQKKGVAKILINGTGLCTGSLINNVEQDCRPLFLTADHCLGNVDAIANPNAPGWVFYWNFERTGCANVGDPVDDTQTTSGAVLLANAGEEINAPMEDPAAASDFALFLLDENPADSYDVYFNGFDASGATGMGGVGIHHPAGDAKKIATHNITPASVVNNNYWRILPWSVTANGQSVTEGGSSGSPLFNPTGLIIGQLFGGFAGGQPNCSDPDNDEGDYGRMDVSWNFGATATRRLRDHLDPMNTGTTIVSGQDGSVCCNLDVSCALITDQTLTCRADLPPVDFDLPIIIESCGDPILSALTIIPGNSGCPGDEVTITRTYFIQDQQGNMAECMQTFTVISNNGPTISCPSNQTVTCAADISVSASDATVTADCGTPSVTVNGPVINGDPDCDGTTYTYTYTVTDFCNRMASCDQVFTISNAAPTIVCAPNEIVECVSDINPSAADVTTTTACTLGSTLDISDPVIIGPAGCDGTVYQYTYTITDDCGRSASCMRSYTLDNDGPTISCPASITFECEEDIMVDANDANVVVACGLDFQIKLDGPEIFGIQGCAGSVYQYTYTVMDECGRSASCVQFVSLANDGPTITCPPGETVECSADIMVNPNNAAVTTSCGYDFDVMISGPVIDGNADCPGSTYTYTYRVLDECGRSATCEQVFTIGNNDGPTIEAPADQLIECDYQANVNPDYAMVTTSCGQDFDVTVSEPVQSGPANCPGTTYTYTYTVTDACGRSASDVRVFTIANDGPEIECPNPLFLNCEDFTSGSLQAKIQAWLSTASARSSCGFSLGVTNTYNPFSLGMCTSNPFTNVTFFATDDCGRTTSCQSTIIMADTEPPVVFEEASDDMASCYDNFQGEFQMWLAERGGAVILDACWDNLSWSTIPSFPTINCNGGMGSTTVTFRATDGCGNFATTTATFTVMAGNNLIDSEDEAEIAEIGITEEQGDNVLLYQNRPNPFKGQTTIGFYLPESQTASLTVYDISGRVLKVIQSNYDSGYNEVNIDRAELPVSGMLLYRLDTAEGSFVKKMIVLD